MSSFAVGFGGFNISLISDNSTQKQGPNLLATTKEGSVWWTQPMARLGQKFIGGTFVCGRRVPGDQDGRAVHRQNLHKSPFLQVKRTAMTAYSYNRGSSCSCDQPRRINRGIVKRDGRRRRRRRKRAAQPRMASHRAPVGGSRTCVFVLHRTITSQYFYYGERSPLSWIPFLLRQQSGQFGQFHKGRE